MTGQFLKKENLINKINEYILNKFKNINE